MAWTAEPRLIRSVRARPVAFTVLLVLSALSVTVAVLTPLLLRAVQVTALQGALAAGGTSGTSIVGTAQAASGEEIGDAGTATQQMMDAVGEGALWHRPVTVVVSETAHPWVSDDAPYRRPTALIAVVNTCAGFTITSGRCPKSGTQVMIPASVQDRLHIPLQTGVEIDPDVYHHPSTRLVGVYDDARRLGRQIGNPALLTGVKLPVSGPSLIVGASDEADLPLAFTVIASRQVRLPVSPEEGPAVQRALARAQQATLSEVGAETVAKASSHLPGVLARARVQADAAAELAATIGVTAIGLAWFALAFTVQRIGRARAAEWGVGRMRGIRAGRWFQAVFLEPGAAILLGSAIGVPLGIGAAGVVARLGMGQGAGVEPFRPLVAASAALTLAGSLVALLAASRRSARLPLSVLLRETTEPRQVSRTALVAQTAVILGAVAILWTVLTQGPVSGPQLALLSPVVIALLVAIVTLRVAVAIARSVTSRSPRSALGLLVGRQLTRAPSVLYAGVMVTVGFALAAYSLELALVSERLQVQRADASVGAATILTVSVPSGTSLLTAVRQADPSGRSALAAEEVAGPGAMGTGRVVAVDVRRLAAVTTWRRDWWGRSPSRLVTALDPPARPGPEVHGRRLTLVVGSVQDGASEDLPPGSPPDLTVVVGTASRWDTVELGPLRAGELTAPLPCSGGCRIVAVGVDDRDAVGPSPWGASFVIRSLSTDEQSSAMLRPLLHQGGLWRHRIADESDSAQPEKASADPAIDGLHVDVEDEDGGLTPQVEPAVGPSVLPALASRGTDLQPFAGIPDAAYGSDLTRSALVLRIVGRAAILPRSLDDGVLVDLGTIDRLADPTDTSATPEVWLTPGPHTAVLSALAREGVRVTHRSTLIATRDAYLREAPVRAAALLVAAAVTAIVLTILAVLGARLVGVPGRRTDRIALLTAGYRIRTLRVLALVEVAVPAVAGVLLGVGSAVTAFVVTAPRLPLLAGDSAAPPPDLAPAPAPLLVLAAVGVAAVLLAAAITARVEYRSAE